MADVKTVQAGCSAPALQPQPALSLCRGPLRSPLPHCKEDELPLRAKLSHGGLGDSAVVTLCSLSLRRGSESIWRPEGTLAINYLDYPTPPLSEKKSSTRES